MSFCLLRLARHTFPWAWGWWTLQESHMRRSFAKRNAQIIWKMAPSALCRREREGGEKGAVILRNLLWQVAALRAMKLGESRSWIRLLWNKIQEWIASSRGLRMKMQFPPINVSNISDVSNISKDQGSQIAFCIDIYDNARKMEKAKPRVLMTNWRIWQEEKEAWLTFLFFALH